MSEPNVLFFAADPLSVPPDGRSPRLLLDEDVRQIGRKVRAAEHRDALHFDFRLAARPDDLMQALNETRPMVVHFSGHGNLDGLVLASADGTRAHPVDAAALRQLFQVFRGDVRVVVLSACLSQPQAEAVAEAVGCAIGTRGSISDAAAITFDAAFYRALAFGHSVRLAFEQARTALALEHPEERDCPVLVTRPDVDPARLVVVPAVPGSPAASPEPGSGPPVRDDGARAHALPAPAAPRARAARARRRIGIAAVAVALASGIALVRGEPFGRGDARDPGVPAEAPGSGDAELSAGGSPLPSPADEAAVPDDLPPTEALAAAKQLYEDGRFADAFPLFERAAEAGEVEAMGFLGEMFLNGAGTERNPVRAVLWLRKAAEERDPRSMNGLGAAFERGEGENQSHRWARYWYTQAAEKGFAPAMANLGRMYDQGLGVEASGTDALAWYGRAAKAGHVDAMVDAGAVHQSGRAGARDPAEALRLYVAAADAGSTRGMVAAGKMHQEGDGVPRNYEKANDWYRQAAERGSADAMYLVGTLYENGGPGVRRNGGTAAHWFRRAAEAGSAAAAARLATTPSPDGARRETNHLGRGG